MSKYSVRPYNPFNFIEISVIQIHFIIYIFPGLLEHGILFQLTLNLRVAFKVLRGKLRIIFEIELSATNYQIVNG